MADLALQTTSKKIYRCRIMVQVPGRQKLTWSRAQQQFIIHEKGKREDDVEFNSGPEWDYEYKNARKYWDKEGDVRYELYLGIREVI